MYIHELLQSSGRQPCNEGPFLAYFFTYTNCYGKNIKSGKIHNVMIGLLSPQTKMHATCRVICSVTKTITIPTDDLLLPTVTLQYCISKIEVIFTLAYVLPNRTNYGRQVTIV